MTEQQPTTCGVGSKTAHPCPNPAAERMWGDSGPWVCEGHKLAFELGDEEGDLEESLGYLKRWIRTADRYNVEPLRTGLRTLRDGYSAELAALEASQREAKERYSLPPDGLEQLQAKQREKEGSPKPEAELTEAERRFREFDRRASRFNAAIGEIEEQIDLLHARLEEEVLPLLEEEADKANEEAGRVKAEFGF